MTAVLVNLEPPSRNQESAGDVELVMDLDVLSESDMCSCAASDDNPY